MNGGAYSQPTIVLALCGALARLDAQTLSARILADAIAQRFPHAPATVLRVHASRVLKVFYDPPTILDIEAVGLAPEDMATALDVFAAEYRSICDSLLEEIERQDGANVVNINGGGPA